MAKLLAALLALAAVTHGQDITADSNFGVQSGPLTYLFEYVFKHGTTYGIVLGRGQVLRHAAEAKTTISLGMYLQTPAAVQGNHFLATIYTGAFNSDNAVPLSCASNEGGCGGAGEPMFVVNVTSPLGFIEQTFSWPVHIDTRTSRSLSVVLLDTMRGNEPMACAELKSDRGLSGLPFALNEDTVGGARPTIRTVDVALTERGTSTVKLGLGNLRADIEYPAYVYTMPCLAGDLAGLLGGSRLPGPRYKRAAECQASGVCDATEENEVWLTLKAAQESNGLATTTVELDTVLRAGAQSIVVFSCASSGAGGECASDPQIMVCVNLVNDAVNSNFASKEPTDATNANDANFATDSATTVEASTAIDSTTAIVTEVNRNDNNVDTDTSGSGSSLDQNVIGNNMVALSVEDSRRTCPIVEEERHTSFYTAGFVNTATLAHTCCLPAYSELAAARFHVAENQHTGAAIGFMVFGVACAVVGVGLMALQRSRSWRAARELHDNQDDYAVIFPIETRKTDMLYSYSEVASTPEKRRGDAAAKARVTAGVRASPRMDAFDM